MARRGHLRGNHEQWQTPGAETTAMDADELVMSGTTDLANAIHRS